jgi:D-glycero-D-manno-heptose 1,7-bisphosphate phosphatase
MRPALFLDRDGVINVDHGYVYRPEDFEFIDGVFELVAAANAAGYLVIVVTNQAGIGRGIYTEEDFHALTNWMQGQFILRGAKIDAVYFCPFHPEHGVGKYRYESDHRKPGPGMLLQAAKEHCIDLKKSLMVGDKISDMVAGQRAFVGTLLYIGNESTKLGLTICELKDILPFLSFR